jgi:hypothetical protein
MYSAWDFNRSVELGVNSGIDRQFLAFYSLDALGCSEGGQNR